jgi:hypothetical protein
MLKWVLLYLNLILKMAETEILFKTKQFIQQNQKIKKIAYIMLGCVKFLMLWHPSLTGLLFS